MLDFLRTLVTSLFIRKRLLVAGGTLVGIFIFGYFFPVFTELGKAGTGLLAALTLVDAFMLYGRQGNIEAKRLAPERFSNGDFNTIKLDIRSNYDFPVALQVIDEAPIQFQLRDSVFDLRAEAGSETALEYLLRPVRRGQYVFGDIRLFAVSPLGLLTRRFTVKAQETVACYPSFMQMRKYQLMAVSNRLNEIGIKRMRRIGNTTEFEQVKEYVPGDDYRSINWKATARTGRLMANQYTDERSQHIVLLIDKGRTMKMPFEEMSLLDYAINAALVMADVAIRKHDRAALLTFSNTIDSYLPPNERPTQIGLIQEALYAQTTDFMEADYELLYAFVKRQISRRSMLLLFCNFESLQSLERQLPYLQKLAKQHLLVVVLFENTELRALLTHSPANTEEIYQKAIGEHFIYEKRLMVRELQRHGIHALLSTPQSLTVDALNKYLEIKAKGSI